MLLVSSSISESESESPVSSSSPSQSISVLVGLTVLTVSVKVGVFSMTVVSVTISVCVLLGGVLVVPPMVVVIAISVAARQGVSTLLITPSWLCQTKRVGEACSINKGILRRSTTRQLAGFHKSLGELHGRMRRVLGDARVSQSLLRGGHEPDCVDGFASHVILARIGGADRLVWESNNCVRAHHFSSLGESQADPAFSFVDELNGQRLIELIHHVAHSVCAGIAKLDEIFALKRTVELLRFNATAEEKETKYE
jgi:hypothetical protein